MILRKSESGELTIIDPIWYGGISSVLIEMIIGYKFENEKELQVFVFDLQEALLIGSEISKEFKKTIFEKSTITFDLMETFRNKNVWRKIEIGIKNNKIEFLTSTNPITNEIRTIEK